MENNDSETGSLKEVLDEMGKTPDGTSGRLEQITGKCQNQDYKHMYSSSLQTESDFDKKKAERKNLEKITENFQNQDYKEVNSSSVQRQPDFKSYNKKKGVIDKGKEYEIQMCALYALKFSTNDKVLDFNMTTNNDKCGDFDDIELQVSFKNDIKRTYLFQLKHKENKKERITEEMLTKEFLQRNKKQERSKFYLPNYFQSMGNIKIKTRDIVCILYTNSQAEIENGEKLEFKHYNLEGIGCDNIEHEDLLVNAEIKVKNIYQFRPDFNTKTKESEEMEKLCQRFYFFTRQDNLEDVKASVEKKLKKILNCDIYGSFEHFMKTWWSDNFTLTKHHVIAKLTELSLSPYIRTISAEKSNEKTQLLEEAIMKFEMTLAEDSQEDIVRNIWTETNTAYDWTSSKLQKFFESSSEMQISKIFWYLGKAPLVVKFDNSNATTVNSVLTLLQNDNQLNRVVLLGDAKKVDFNQRKVFENLADLEKNFGNSQFYKDLISNFNVTFQDRDCISLEKVSAIDGTIAELIGTTELLKMSQTENFLMGNGKEELPPFYIPRCVSSYLININNILNFYKVGGDNVVIINCDTNIKKNLQMQNVQVVELSEYLTEESKGETIKNILVSTSNRCTRVQFNQICKKFKKSNVYVFQVKPNDECSLVLMKGRNPFVKKRIIEEKYILHHFNNPLNVFCAPPGMGKSSLMKVLNNNTPSDFWAIHVELIKYNSFLAKRPNSTTILSRFLKMDQDEGRLTTRIKETLWRSKKMYFFLDGLDEVDSDHLDLVVEFAKTVSSDGFNVWISSRENLREKINQDLNVEPIEIEELDEKQQQQFIQSKLEKKYSMEKIEKIVKAAYDSVDINNSQNLLGIPLQLHIITEMFLNNEDAYTDLEQQNIFVLTHMYKLFFQGKVKNALEKLGLDESSKAQLGIKDEEILEKYELPALKSCLDQSDYEKLNVTFENIPTSIECEGDKYGIIKSVNENDEVVFNHQTYAEYFACEWFRKHKDQVKIFNNRIFSGRYENLRRILDIMMAECSPLHLAVIYENIDQFNKNIGDIKKVDYGGRTVLHLACSYGIKYEEGTYFEFLNLRQRESVPYLEMMEQLVHSDVDIYAMDDLFEFNCVNYATESKCLYPIEKMLEKNLIPSKDLYAKLRKYDNIEALALYAARFGYSSLLRELLKYNPKLVHHRAENKKSLLKTALLGNKSDDCLKPRNGNVTAVKLLVAFGADFKELYQKNSYEDPLNLLDIVCRKGRYDMIKPLIEIGVECSGGNTVLHRMLEIYKLDLKMEIVVLNIVQILEIDINAQNNNGTTALQIACQRKHFAMIEALFEIGANPDIKDNMNSTALHYAYRYDPNIEIIGLLIHREIDINTQNINGVAALQLACEHGHTDIVNLLLEKGADPHVVDNQKRNILHYVCNSQKPNVLLANLVTDLGIDVNALTEEGTSALQLACKSGCTKTIRFLLDNGADPYVEDSQNKNILHYLCESNKSNTEIGSLLIDLGLDVNTRTENGSSALQLACSAGNTKMIKLLVDKGADCCITDHKERNTLHYACETYRPNTETISSLIDCYGINVNAKDTCGTTPFLLACKSGNTENLKLLLTKGADPTIKNNKGRTALHDISQSNSYDILKVLTNIDIDVNAQDDEGVTALHLACKHGSIYMVNSLREKDADLDIIDHTNRNALHYACDSFTVDMEIISLLITLGINVNAQDKKGTTALQLVSRSGYIGSLKFLLNAGATLNIKDNKNRNALHYACGSFRTRTEVISLLITFGIDVKSQDENGMTALHLACKNRYTDVVKILLEKGADPNVKDNEEKNLFHFVCDLWDTNLEIVSLLIEFGIEINARAKDGSTVLQLLSKEARVDFVNLLLEKGADPYIQDNIKNTVLHYACNSFQPNTKIISLLFDYNIDLNARNEEGTTPFLLACNNGQIENVNFLLARGADPNIEDNQKRNALHYACKSFRSNPEIVNLLIDLGIDLNAQTEQGTTALQLACGGVGTENVEILLQRGANLYTKDNKKRNVLHYACDSYSPSIETIDLLIRRGVDVNAQTEDGTTPLQLASQGAEVEAVTLLLEKGADPNSKDNKNANALHYACNSFEAIAEIVNLLVNLDVDVNAQNQKGTTPFHLACLSGQTVLVKFLVERGADLNVKDYEDKKALHYACMSDRTNAEIISDLLKLGFDINAQDKNGRTALQYACDCGIIENVRLLLEEGADPNVPNDVGETALDHVRRNLSSYNTRIEDLLLKYNARESRKKKWSRCFCC